MLALSVFTASVSAQEPADEEISDKVMIAPTDCFAYGQKVDVHKGPRFEYGITIDGDPKIINLETDEDLSDLKPGQLCGVDASCGKRSLNLMKYVWTDTLRGQSRTLY
jgi:hypothetical protein